jgi:predicted amino acid-binding ACT domain protein
LSDDEETYFPRRLNIVVPLGESIHQFVIVGKDEVGALAKAAEVLARHGVNLVSGGTYDADAKEEFVFSMFAELAKADCTSETLASELRALPFISSVSVSAADKAVYDQHLFPVVLFGSERAVIVTAQSIAFMEQDLQKQIGKQGLQVLFEVGRSGGLGLSALHKSMMPEADREQLLRTAVDDMRARGWGLVSLEFSKDARTSVTVKQPIFGEIEGAKTSWWLMGLVSGFMEAIYGHRTVVSGRPSFVATTKIFKFELVEFSPDSRSNRQLA